MRDIPFAINLKLIHAFEGKNGTFEATRQQDPGGLWEIGWSHRLTGPEDPDWDATYDAARADEVAKLDLTRAAAGVCEAVGTAIADLNDGQYAALIDFAYNEGVGAFLQSTLCKMVIAGNHVAAAAEFPKWIYATVEGVKTPMPGLVRRRQAELDCWTV